MCASLGFVAISSALYSSESRFFSRTPRLLESKRSAALLRSLFHRKAEGLHVNKTERVLSILVNISRAGMWVVECPWSLAGYVSFSFRRCMKRLTLTTELKILKEKFEFEFKNNQRSCGWYDFSWVCKSISSWVSCNWNVENFCKPKVNKIFSIKTLSLFF